MIRDPGSDKYDPDKLNSPLSRGDGHSILQAMLLNQTLVQTALIALRRNDMAMVDAKIKEIDAVRKDNMLFLERFEATLIRGASE